MVDMQFKHLEKSTQLQKHIGIHLQNFSLFAFLETDDEKEDVETDTLNLPGSQSDATSMDLSSENDMWNPEFDHEELVQDFPELENDVEWEYVSLAKQIESQDDPLLQRFSQLAVKDANAFGDDETTSSAMPTPTTGSVDFNFNQHNLELAQAELKTASESFDANFHKYLAKNTSIVTFDAEINAALHASHQDDDIQQSAKQFRQQLNKVIHVRSQNAELASHKWYNKVGSFVLSLYPAVRMTLGVTSEIAAVSGQYVLSFADCVEHRVFTLASWGQWPGFDISGELLPNF